MRRLLTLFRRSRRVTPPPRPALSIEAPPARLTFDGVFRRSGIRPVPSLRAAGLREQTPRLLRLSLLRGPLRALANLRRSLRPAPRSPHLTDRQFGVAAPHAGRPGFDRADVTLHRIHVDTDTHHTDRRTS